MEWEEAQFSPEELSAIQGSLTEAVEFKKQRDAGHQVEAREEENTSFARAHLATFRHLFGDFLQPLEVFDEEHQLLDVEIKTLDASDYLEVGVWMARDGFTLFDLTSRDAQMSLYAALFVVSVFKTNGERFFEDGDAARAWWQEPGFIEAPFLLRDVIFERNERLKKALRPDGLEKILYPLGLLF